MPARNIIVVPGLRETERIPERRNLQMTGAHGFD
jgi:hypothetical protein